MTKLPKKMAVLALLRQQGAAISLPELLALLSEGYAERTVRRWLSELVAAGLHGCQQKNIEIKCEHTTNKT